MKRDTSSSSWPHSIEVLRANCVAELVMRDLEAAVELVRLELAR
jgi:hypothetical protein